MVKTNGSLQKKIKEQEIYALNLNSESSDLCIQNAQEKIAEIEGMKEKLMPTYQEKKDFYQSVLKEFQAVQAEMDSLDERIAKQQTVINAFKTFNSNTSNVKVLRRLDNPENAPPQAEHRLHVSWLEEVAALLEKTNRFMTFEEIWAEFGKDQSLVDRCNKNKTKFTSMHWAVIGSLQNHVKRPAGSRLYKGISLSVWHDKYGFTSWVDEEGNPYDKTHTKPAPAINHIQIEYPQDEVVQVTT